MRISLHGAKGPPVLLPLVLSGLVVTLSPLLPLPKAPMVLQQHPLSSVALIVTMSSMCFKSLTCHILQFPFSSQHPIPFYHRLLNSVLGFSVPVGWWVTQPPLRFSVCSLRLLLVSAGRLGSPGSSRWNRDQAAAGLMGRMLRMDACGGRGSRMEQG